MVSCARGTKRVHQPPCLALTHVATRMARVSPCRCAESPTTRSRWCTKSGNSDWEKSYGVTSNGFSVSGDIPAAYFAGDPSKGQQRVTNIIIFDEDSMFNDQVGATGSETGSESCAMGGPSCTVGRATVKIHFPAHYLHEASLQRQAEKDLASAKERQAQLQVALANHRRQASERAVTAATEARLRDITSEHQTAQDAKAAATRSRAAMATSEERSRREADITQRQEADRAAAEQHTAKLEQARRAQAKLSVQVAWTPADERDVASRSQTLSNAAQFERRVEQAKLHCEAGRRQAAWWHAGCFVAAAAVVLAAIVYERHHAPLTPRAGAGMLVLAVALALLGLFAGLLVPEADCETAKSGARVLAGDYEGFQTAEAFQIGGAERALRSESDAVRASLTTAADWAGGDSNAHPGKPYPGPADGAAGATEATPLPLAPDTRITPAVPNDADARDRGSTGTGCAEALTTATIRGVANPHQLTFHQQKTANVSERSATERCAQSPPATIPGAATPATSAPSATGVSQPPASVPRLPADRMATTNVTSWLSTQIAATFKSLFGQQDHQGAPPVNPAAAAGCSPGAQWAVAPNHEPCLQPRLLLPAYEALLARMEKGNDNASLPYGRHLAPKTIDGAVVRPPQTRSEFVQQRVARALQAIYEWDRRNTLSAEGYVRYIEATDNGAESTVAGVAGSASGPLRRTGAVGDADASWFLGIDKTQPEVRPWTRDTVLAAVVHAFHNHTGHWLRPTQVLAVLALRDRYGTSAAHVSRATSEAHGGTRTVGGLATHAPNQALRPGALLQVRTSEGKTMIICAHTLSLALADKRVVDIITSSSKLASRDASEQRWLYEGVFNMTVAATNGTASSMACMDGTSPYLASVLYTSPSAASFDRLREHTHLDGRRCGRLADAVVLDEADMFLDRALHVTQVSMPTPGMDFIEGARAVVWSWARNAFELGGEVFLAVDVEMFAARRKVVSHLCHLEVPRRDDHPPDAVGTSGSTARGGEAAQVDQQAAAQVNQQAAQAKQQATAQSEQWAAAHSEQQAAAQSEQPPYLDKLVPGIPRWQQTTTREWVRVTEHAVAPSVHSAAESPTAGAPSPSSPMCPLAYATTLDGSTYEVVRVRGRTRRAFVNTVAAKVGAMLHTKMPHESDVVQPPAPVGPKDNDGNGESVQEKRDALPEPPPPQVAVPSHLQAFIQLRLRTWAEMALAARTSVHADHHYVVDRVRKRIVHVDFASTGELQPLNAWSDALDAFVHYKEGLDAPPEMLAGPHLSYAALFQSYASIHGLSGTLGSAAERASLQGLYPSCKFVLNLPRAEVSRFKLLPGWVVADAQQWRNAVVDSVHEAVEAGRSALVILERLEHVAMVTQALSAAALPDTRVYEYTRSDSAAHKQVPEVPLGAGEIVVSTNLGARGTNFRATDQVRACVHSSV